MNLLEKIQGKLHSGSEAKTSDPAQTGVSKLNNLPDQEKLKVLDYLSSVKDLHTNEPAK